MYPSFPSCYKRTMPNLMHEELERRAKVLLLEVHQLWNGKVFQDVAFAWAGTSVKDDNGMEINDLVGCDLPDGDKNYQRTLIDMAARVQACATMLVKREEDKVVAIFETHEGSKSWIYPLELHGDVRVLGEPTIKTDTECLGVLWQKGMGSS